MGFILPQEGEISTLHSVWKIALLDADIVTQKVSSQIQVLSQINPIFFNYSKNLGKIMSTTIDSFKAKSPNPDVPLAPGLPGYQEFHIQRLSEIIIEASSLLQDIGTELQNAYIPFLSKTLQDRNKIVNFHRQNAKEKYKAWKRTLADMKNCNSQLNSMRKDMISQQNKRKKDIQKISLLCNKYAELFVRMKQLSRTLNLEFIKYNGAVSAGLKEIKEIDKQKQTGIFEIGSQFSTIFKHKSEGWKNLFNEIQRTHSDWFSGFMKFIIYNGITRTKLMPKELNPFQFSFVDDDLNQQISRKTTISNDPPILFAVCLHDFEGIFPGEMSIKKGQEIYLYEPPLDKWCMASDVATHPTGYIPTSAIKILNLKTGISMTTRLQSGEFMSLVPGELLIILQNDKKEGILLCRKINGTTGKAYINDVKLE